jgi:hypothetical protein
MRKIEKRIIDTVDEYERVGATTRRDVLSSRDIVETCDINGVIGVAVILYYTTIAKVLPDRVVINTGGWRTNITKSRLNAILWEYCATGIYQKDFTWYLTGGPRILYVEDGMGIPRRNWEVSDL